MRIYKNKNLELDAKIKAMQIEQKKDLIALKTEWNYAYDQLRPSQLLKRAVIDIKEESETKNNLLEILISITGGYLSKKLLVGKSTNLFKTLLGYTVQFVTTKLISKKI